MVILLIPLFLAVLAFTPAFPALPTAVTDGLQWYYDMLERSGGFFQYILGTEFTIAVLGVALVLIAFEELQRLGQYLWRHTLEVFRL
jgi:hypothetical protein